ncbi:MAG: hypothetical protein KGL50_06105 [Burkholderiales bacterium]|nr:hypothetical protein [Burkholderiales bacterium]
MSTSKPSALARLQQLSPFVRKRLEPMLESSVVADLVVEDEARRLTRRHELIAVLKAAPAKHEKAMLAAAEAARKAQADHVAAQAAAVAAMQAAGHASQLARAAELTFSREVGAAESELAETADPRLGDAIFWLRDQEDKLRLSVATWPVHSRSAGTMKGTVTWASNLQEVQAARAAITESVNRLRALQLAPVTAAEVEKAIAVAFAEAQPLLAAFELLPPRLVDGEVKRPLPTPASMLTSGRENLDD